MANESLITLIGLIRAEYFFPVNITPLNPLLRGEKGKEMFYNVAISITKRYFTSLFSIRS